jgi:uncharacterized protein (DUF2384 family)
MKGSKFPQSVIMFIQSTGIRLERGGLIQMTNQSQTEEERKTAIVVKALTRLQTNWDITHDDISKILGIEANSWQKITERRAVIDAQTTNTAALLLNCYQLLSNRMGDDTEVMQHWLKSFNKDFKQQPLDLIKSHAGLNEVVDYLSAFAIRGG